MGKKHKINRQFRAARQAKKEAAKAVEAAKDIVPMTGGVDLANAPDATHIFKVSRVKRQRGLAEVSVMRLEGFNLIMRLENFKSLEDIEANYGREVLERYLQSPEHMYRDRSGVFLRGGRIEDGRYTSGTIALGDCYDQEEYKRVFAAMKKAGAILGKIVSRVRRDREAQGKIYGGVTLEEYLLAVPEPMGEVLRMVI